MWAYTYIAFGISSFLLGAAFVNMVLIARYQFSYPKNYLIFTILYLVLIAGMSLVMGKQAPFLNSANFIFIAIMLGLYTVFGIYMKRVRPTGDFTSLFRIPANQHAMLSLDGFGCWAKVWEIIMQQMVAFMIVSGLLMLGLSTMSAGLCFMTIVFLVHLPSVHFFGPVFGNFFLWASTIISVIYPVIIQGFSAGWGVMVSIHILFYIVWYSYIWRVMIQNPTK